MACARVKIRPGGESEVHSKLIQILQVRLGVANRPPSSFLPGWLKTPLGYPARSAAANGRPVGGMATTLGAVQPPALQRHSADAVQTGLRPAGKPLLRSISEVASCSRLLSSADHDSIWPVMELPYFACLVLQDHRKIQQRRRRLTVDCLSCFRERELLKLSRHLTPLRSKTGLMGIDNDFADRGKRKIKTIVRDQFLTSTS